MSINGNSPTVDDVYDVLGRADGKHPILLPINAGEKGPQWGGWSKITCEETLTPAYQSRLYSKANTGVLLGVTDDLCAIDCDTHAFLAEFLRLNPEFEKTLRTRGGSGGQLWAYVTGERPHQIHDLAVKKDSPLAIGTRKKANADGNISIGEFRAEGGQSVIRGIHPSSFNYTWPVVAHPITIDFDSIQWPNDVELPWVPKRPSAKKTSADKTLLQRAIVRLTINFLWDHFGYPERTRNPVRSPWFPDDKDTSFSIYNQGRNFKDHDPGRPTHRGDSFDFYQLATGKTTGEAFKEFVELAGLGGELKNAHTSPAPSPAPLCDVVRRLAIYYDPERGSFWKPDDRDIWIKISETGIARHLAEAGFDPQKPKGGAISQVGRILNKIQLSMNVEYADSLAGYRKGITEFAGKRLLILDSPKLIEPVPGDHRIVGTFLY